LGLFSSEKSAKNLDSTAAALHTAGTKVAGTVGGKAADAIANAVIAPLRNLSPHACTRPDCNHN
jgi:hypothetical protein